MKKSFIHCADIHLGRKQFNSEERWIDFGSSLEDIINSAIDKAVDYILLSGDFFHERTINAKTLSLSTKLLLKAKTAHIEVIAIEGNHDKALYKDRQSWLEYLDREGYIKLLSLQYDENGTPLIQPYDNGCGNMLINDDLRIIGLGYLGATTPKRIVQIKDSIEDFDGYTVVMLHAAVDTLLGQSLGGFKSEAINQFSNVDYFALGHIHSRYEGEKWYNPGSPEYVHLDEAKPKSGADPQKGYYYVVVDGKNAEVNFLESKKRQVIYREIDVSSCSTPQQVKEYVLQEIDALKDTKAIFYARLVGEVAFSPVEIDIYSIEEKINECEWFFYSELMNMCSLKGKKSEELNTLMDRDEIERIVFRRMLDDKYPDNELEDGIEDLIASIKDGVLNGEDPKQIADVIDEYALREDIEELLNEDK